MKTEYESSFLACAIGAWIAVVFLLLGVGALFLLDVPSIVRIGYAIVCTAVVVWMAAVAVVELFEEMEDEP